MSASSRGGFDPAKPLILLILIATFVAAGFAFRYWSEYREWDGLLLQHLQDWQGYDAQRDSERKQKKSVAVRQHMINILQEINTLPIGFDRDQREGIGSFLENLAISNSVIVTSQTERVDSRGGIEEKRFTFEVKGASRRQLTNFLFQAETQRPILKCLELSNFRQSNSKSDDFEHWDCRVTMAYRRAMGK